MSTPGPAPSPERPRVPLFWKIVSIASTLFLLLSLVAIVWIASIARGTLPRLDGAAELSGLSQAVKVVRDAQGVPHITAATRHDLLVAQGYVTAQDRLWQMDMLRRLGNGTLSEILGERFVTRDVGQRYLLLGRVAARTAASLSLQDRADLQAYCDGVNAYIESHRDHLPVEFQILRYSPRPWTPADSLLIGLHMSSMLTNLWPAELQREKVTIKLGPELAPDLYPVTSWRDRPPGIEPASLQSNHPDSDDDDEDLDADVQRAAARDRERPTPAGHASSADDPAVARLAAQIDSWTPERTLPGSNNWVVSGAHTVSGKPLLSNDMHLPHQMPNLWYEAHLKTTDLDVAGVTLPGVPYVIVGHNQRIAWGFTNLGANVQDLFVETFNDKGQYQTPEGWKDPVRVPEVVHVKGGRDVQAVVNLTRHGPVVSDLVPGEKRKLALAWTVYNEKGVPISFGALNAAQNWEQFCAALSGFPGPAQNVVYADVDGHIGYHAAGFVPVRRSGDGSLPVPGHTNDYEWTGYVPFDNLPAAYDPPSGILATANSRVTPNGYPYLISTHWMTPYRVQRIYKVLESGKKFSAADMLALQMDIYSDLDHYFADKLVYAVDHVSTASSKARAAADILRAWDGRLTADSAAATIESSARQQLFRLLLEPKLGPDFVLYDWWMAPVALENILDRQLPRWLPKQYPSYDHLLVAALERGLAEGTVPRDLRSWQWGKQVTLNLEHPILGNLAVIRRWAGPGVHAISGDAFTVKQLTPTIGPSERMTVDLADLDGSTLNIVTGQSGHIFSPNYLDQWKAWYDGTTFPLPFSDAAVASAKKHELTLEPKK